MTETLKYIKAEIRDLAAMVAHHRVGTRWIIEGTDQRGYSISNITNRIYRDRGLAESHLEKVHAMISAGHTAQEIGQFFRRGSAVL
jgi:hypothetical protein